MICRVGLTPTQNKFQRTTRSKEQYLAPYQTPTIEKGFVKISRAASEAFRTGADALICAPLLQKRYRAKIPAMIPTKTLAQINGHQNGHQQS
jgi:hypothetical protein